ncbi:MAG TPA: hypothetical protein VII72_20110 [Myxococcota bacterium]
MKRLPLRAATSLALLAFCVAACETQSPLRIRPGPVVPSQDRGMTPEALRKVAVVPFYPLAASTTPGSSGPGTSWADAALVSNFVAEALAAQGVPAVAPNDVELAFTAQGAPVPRLDPEATAVRCARDFGATAVVLGRLLRYREREGSAAGSTRPASVAFEVTVYEAPTARRLWTGRFDETQQAITEAILRARQYPGGGTRWLSAAEFARWGATEVAKAITSRTETSP